MEKIMTYKTGETPQKNDEVLGEIEGKPARGRVLAVRENGDVLVTRRAPYQGNTKPLASIHQEVPADQFSLVYRPRQRPDLVIPKAVPVKDATKAKESKTAGAAKK